MFTASSRNPPLSYFGPTATPIGSYGEEKRESRRERRKKKKTKSRRKTEDVNSVKTIREPRRVQGRYEELLEKHDAKKEKNNDNDDDDELRSEEDIRQEVNTLLRGFFVNTDEERFLSDVNMFLKSVCGNVGVPISEAWAGGISGGLEGLVALALEQMRIRGVFALFGRREFVDKTEPSFRSVPAIKTKDESDVSYEQLAASKIQSRIKPQRIGAKEVVSASDDQPPEAATAAAAASSSQPGEVVPSGEVALSEETTQGTKRPFAEIVDDFLKNYPSYEEEDAKRLKEQSDLIKELEAQRDELAKRQDVSLETRQEQLRKLDEDIDRLRKEYTKNERELAALTLEVYTAKENLERLSVQIEQATREKEEAEAAKSAAQQEADAAARQGSAQQEEAERKLRDAEIRLQQARDEYDRLEREHNDILDRAQIMARLASLEERIDSRENVEWILEQLTGAINNGEFEQANAFTSVLRDKVKEWVKDALTTPSTTLGISDAQSLIDTIKDLSERVSAVEFSTPSSSMKDDGNDDTGNLNEIKRGLAELSQRVEMLSSPPSKDTVKKWIDDYLAEKRAEAESGVAASSSSSVPGTSIFGRAEDIKVAREDEDFRQQKKELAEARAQLAVATRTLEVANERLTKQARDAKDDDAKIAQLQRATDNIERQAAQLDVRKRDLDLRESMLSAQREQQLTTRLRGGASRGRGGSRRGGGGGGGGGGGPPNDDGGSGDFEYDQEMQRRGGEARARAAEIDLQRKMVELQAARRRAEQAGASSSSASSYADPEERAFRQRERELKLRKLEADLQEKMLALSTKRAEADLKASTAQMEDDVDQQKLDDEREKRRLELEKVKVQLQETMAKLANEKRKADREDKRDEAIVDVLEFEELKRQLDLRRLRAQTDKIESENDPDTLRSLRQYEREKRDAERRKFNSETSRPNLRAIRQHEQEKREYEESDWDNRLDKARNDLAKAKLDLARAQARDAAGYDLRKLGLEVERAQAQLEKLRAENLRMVELQPLERQKRVLENEAAQLRIRKQAYDLDNADADRELQKDRIEMEKQKLAAAQQKAREDRAMQREKLDFEKRKNADDAYYNRRKHALELERMEQQNKRQRLDYEVAARKNRREQVIPRRDLRAVYDMLKSEEGADVAQVRAMLSFIGIKNLKDDRVLFEHFLSESFVAAIEHALSSIDEQRKITFVSILSRKRLVYPFSRVVTEAYRYNAVKNSMGSASVLSVQQAARNLGVSISKFKSSFGGSTPTFAQSRSYQRGLLRDMIN